MIYTSRFEATGFAVKIQADMSYKKTAVFSFFSSKCNIITKDL